MLREIMTKNVIKVRSEATAFEVAELMSKEDVGCVVVHENQKPVGVITDRDLVLRCIAEGKDPKSCKVGNLMTSHVEYCQENDGIFDCIAKMKENGIRRLIVTNPQGEITGMISFGDVLALLSKEFFDLTYRTTHAEEQLEAA